MTGAYDELVSAGRFGPQCARMLYRAVQTVAIARNFPPPDGHIRWDADAAMDVAHDFLDGERGRKRITDLAIRATDNASFERLLHAAVLNFHRDRSRRTQVGALIRRVGDVLDRSDLFQETATDPSRWHLPGAPATPSTSGPSALARAAAEEPEVTVPRWTSERRRAPQADFDSIERLKYKDEYRHALEALIEAKIAGREVATLPSESAGAPATDLSSRSAPASRQPKRTGSAHPGLLRRPGRRGPRPDPARTIRPNQRISSVGAIPLTGGVLVIRSPGPSSWGPLHARRPAAGRRRCRRRS